MKSILNETQLDRDMELSAILDIPLDQIQRLRIASPESIRVYGGGKEKLTEEEMERLYQNYSYLKFPAYLRTLMKTSITARSPELIRLLRQTKRMDCLDFGCGVGTHAIALLENKNIVAVLDVEESPLLNFALTRIKRRGYFVMTWGHKDILPDGYYDLIVCSDVLEHVFDPMKEIGKITKALKKNGNLHLQVSNMVKDSSGHFRQSINKWRTHSPSYLRRHYTKAGKTLYVKR